MADKPLTKSQISAAVAEANGITKKEATDLLANIADLALESTKATGAFTFPGIGKLKLVNRQARMGRNPATGDPSEDCRKICRSQGREGLYRQLRINSFS